MRPISRREFLQTAGAALAAGFVPTFPSTAGTEPTWPVGCRDPHLRVAGLEDCWASMKALGAECTEVSVGLGLDCPNLFHPRRQYSVATEDGVKVLAGDLAAQDCRISAFMMSNQFDERLEQELEAARRLVRAARQLGVPAIRIDLWPRKLKVEEFLPFAISTGKRLCEIAADTPVRFGVENHGRVTNDPAFLAKLFDGVGSDKLGLTLDLGNFYWFGHPLDELYHIYEQVAPRAVHTHCKNIRYPADKRNTRRDIGWGYDQYACPIYEGDIDYKRALGILRRAGYRGDLCVEDEVLGKFPQSQRAAIMKKEIELLRSLRRETV